MYKKIIIGVVAFFLGLQLAPYGRDHTNPEKDIEPAWDSPDTRELVVGACFDCHSNQTKWPWYSNIAQVSWLVQNHVDEGRRELNFSEWNRGNSESDDAAEAVREGEMPPRSYLLLHPEARLTTAEREQLARGLDASLGAAQSRAD